MKSSTLAVTAAVLASSTTTTAFQATSPLLSITHHSSSSSSSTTTTLYEYIPSGFTKQSWAEFKKKEAAAKKANLGRVGPKGFQSRSMQSFQEALERGEAEHLLPVFNAKEKVAKGLLKVEDIPYMQRGESWLLIVDCWVQQQQLHDVCIRHRIYMIFSLPRFIILFLIHFCFFSSNSSNNNSLLDIVGTIHPILPITNLNVDIKQ